MLSCGLHQGPLPHPLQGKGACLLSKVSVEKLQEILYYEGVCFGSVFMAGATWLLKANGS